ncbi:MAG: hypothetical protein PUE85_03025 [Firmicutes bacterium]|nr:hypothetical protein [Bacillota bacterium]
MEPVQPTISGKIHSVNWFWNESELSVTISEVMWMVFRKNGCNAVAQIRRKVSWRISEKFPKQRNVLLTWMF